MRYFLAVVVFVLLFLFTASHVSTTSAQLPTFGPSCDITPQPTLSPTPSPTSPPGQPTYTPAPTSTPVPTAIPCSPTLRPNIPTKIPVPPRTGSVETTFLLLGVAGVFVFGGAIGAISFVDKK